MLNENLIIKNTFSVFSGNKKISETLFYFDEKHNWLLFKSSFNFDSLTIKYRKLDLTGKNSFKIHDTSEIVRKLDGFNNSTFDGTKTIDEIIAEDGLNKSGTFSRGISVGNNQDAVVNSKLNLQLNGKLSENLNIEAVITDETIPVQPDGNTAQIQDINKVYIRVFNEKFGLTAGDFQVKNPETHFLKYNKQLKGAGIEINNFDLSENTSLIRSKSDIAVAKGKYNRQTITAIEGNQGPYRLQGNSGETYITVVSGSERVYIDGRLLERGETNDYIIDYNSAEITFTPKTIITKDLRILVEFEYTERNYTRFSAFTNNYISTPKFDFFLNVYSQTDAKNQTIDAELTDEMKMILFDAGDKVEFAFIQNIDSVVFDLSKVLYRKVDTVINENIYSYYEYSTNPQLAHFQVYFTYVGQGNGNYIIDPNNTNGRIYKWVEPKQGLKQGDYEAQTKIVPPQKSVMYDLGFVLPVNANQKLLFEYALSEQDLNLFSPNQDSDNFGNALKLNYKNFLTGNDSSVNQSVLIFDFEFADKRFKPLEVYKSPEFNRNKNILADFNSDEFIGSLKFDRKSKNLILSANSEVLYYHKNYAGISFNPSVKYKNDRNYIDNKIEYLHTSDNFYNTDFLKNLLVYKRKIGKISVGGLYKQETNFWRSKSSDSLMQNSFMFHLYGVNISNSDTINKLLQLNYIRRYDFDVINNNLNISNFSDNFSLKSGFTRKESNLNLIINFRELKIKDTLNSTIEPQNSLSSMLNFKTTFFNQTISYTSSVQILSGLEQKLQFIYIEVEAGKGSYTWNDYNEDGVKQTDEFEIAVFSDVASYIRVALQSNQYVKVFGKTVVQTVFFNPQKMFKENSKIHVFASKFNNTFSFSTTHKSYNNDLVDLSKKNAVNYNLIISNLLNFKVAKNIYFVYQYQNNKISQLLVNGMESNKYIKNKFYLKFLINTYFSIDYEFDIIDKILESEYSVFRNYYLKNYGNSLSIKHTTDKTETGLNYTYFDKRNINAAEALFENKFSFYINGIIGEKNKLGTEISFLNNIFKGEANTSVAYTMLEGLKPDLNILWNINYKRSIAKSLQLSCLYSGRYSSNNKIIHTGGINLTAFF